MLTEATRFRSVLSSQTHRQTCVTYLEMFKLSHILQLENVHWMILGETVFANLKGKSANTLEWSHFFK